jgi:hypothetical protein
MRVLSKGELHNGAEYLGASRLSLAGRWDSSTQKFKVTRFRYGYFFLEDLPHPEDVPAVEDSFKPFFLITEVHDRLALQGNPNA